MINFIILIKNMLRNKDNPINDDIVEMNRSNRKHPNLLHVKIWKQDYKTK